ncbi:MAG: PBP1A family penicillin-binding protein [bacterium]|nr:PBP1A family penicillin-binding protein [bacterium]
MKRLIQILLALVVLGAVACVAGVALFYALILRDLPEIRSLDDYRPKLITRFLDRDGLEIASFAEERRIIMPIEMIPDHVVQAFIAAEDSSFYEHEGLDYPGIMRAALKNLRAGSVKQGGSTITQQVAKTFLLTNERSFIRKMKDMVLARRIERDLDKNQILFLYLNQIYLGSGAYGVEAAAQNYFAKSVTEINTAEAALIAGMVPAPSLWTPFRNRETALRKQKSVLGRMRNERFINEEQYQEELARELVFNPRGWNELRAASSYFVEEVRRYLVTRFGNDRVLTGGMSVKTTIDPQRQLNAYRAVRRGLRAHDRRQGYRGPIKNVPQEEWLSTLAAISESNTEVRHGEEEVYRGLVTAIDDKEGTATLSLSVEIETVLTFEQTNWARVPDPKIDGILPRIKRMSEALHTGDLVWIEKVGDEFQLFQRPLAEGSLVAVDLGTGHLQAMIGGYSFNRSQFNRALQSRRQPGSGFKPFVYAAAIEGGYTPASIVHDTAIVYEDQSTGMVWKPENYSDKFYGPITLRNALAKSRNVATIKILSDIGLGPVKRFARRVGISSKLENNLGLALGNSELTLGELVRGYTSFAAGGRLIDPIYILEIRDRNGEILEENIPLLASLTVDDAEDTAIPDEEELDPGLAAEAEIDVIADPVVLAGHTEQKDHLRDPNNPFDPITAYLMTDMLRAVVEDGTGRRVRALRRPVAGKTGTTNDLRDAWFIGFTPEIAAGVWVGYDQARNLGKNETGSRAASPIFLDYMKTSLKGHTVRDFPVPDGIVFSRINRKTGLRALPGDPDAAFQPFREGTAPQETSPSITKTSRPRLD